MPDSVYIEITWAALVKSILHLSLSGGLRSSFFEPFGIGSTLAASHCKAKARRSEQIVKDIDLGFEAFFRDRSFINSCNTQSVVVSINKDMRRLLDPAVMI